MTRQFSGGKLVIASHNAGKVAEFALLLAPHAAEIVSAAELGLAEPDETGTTFAANAELKAVAAARAAGLAALADDSGLAVAALDGQPGIHSARWAGAGRNFAHAMERIHHELEPGTDRRAWFVCALTLAWPDGPRETRDGRVTGTLVWPPRGDNGFGYDPMFQPDGFERTFGEMAPDDKHAISHRANAFRKLIEACFDGG